MITIYDKNGAVRTTIEELSDSSIKEAVSDEEYASIQFKSNILINFGVGDYIDVYSKRYWIMKIPAPIEKQNSIEYNYTIKFESSRAFLGYVNFELFDNTSIELVPEYNNATSYIIGNVVTYRNLFWQCTQNCIGISPAENDYWSIKSTITNYVPPYNASTTYTYGDIVEYNNNYFMYIYGDDASGNIPKEGDHWTIVKTAPQWDFSTILTPSRYAQLIVDNMRRARPDQDWVVGDCVAKSPLQASFSNVSCLDAASQIAELFETELYVDGFTINFKKKEQSTNISMKYGENGGFQNITRSEVTESSKVTRLVALGGTQNLLSSYRNGSTRLMLPNKYYIDSDNIDLILPIEKTVTWDNIFPCMSHATEDWDSTKTYYAGSQVTYNGYSWDALQTSTNISPVSGSYWRISEGTVTTFISQYKFIDANLTFNPLDSQYIMADETRPKVRFITGNLAGYDFPIAGYEPSTKTITIEQIQDSKNSYIPTASYGMKQGDQYVFIDLYMPQSYVTKNENKLLASAQEYLSIYSRDQVSYSGDVDTIWATNNNINLHAGDLIHVIDDDFDINLEYRIVNVTRRLRNKYEYQITLSTLPRIATRIESIENKLNNVSSQTSNLISNSKSVDILKKDDTRSATDSLVMSALRVIDEFISRKNDSDVSAIVNWLKGIRLNGKELTDIILEEGTEGASDKNVFSALRALSMFLRKDIPDTAKEVIDFLKGLTVNGDKATIDADGNATVQQLIALVKAQIAALEVTGNTKSNSLDVAETATAKDVEVSNSVTTLNAVIQALAKTHDLTVEHTADIMNGIIRDYLTSDSFVSGFLGSGFKIWKDENGLWHGELDELTVRKTFLVFELVVQKIVHQGGMVIRSAAGGKLKKVTDGGTYWKCEHDSTDDFVVGDQVLCQTFTGTSMKRYWRLVTSAGAGYFNLSKSDCEASSANPEAGDEVAVLGNRTVTARQKAQIDCAVGNDAPYRDDYSGINSYSLVGKLINRTGNLSGITDPDFGALSGSGLYGINVYLKGIFRLLSGKTVEDAISDAQAESNAYTDGKITKIETSFEIREGQISSKVTEATVAATNADSSATLAQGYASTAGQKASAAAGSATDAANILTTVTQKETSIQQTAQAIELKAVRAESAAGRAESAEASINLKADGIVLQASNQAAKSAVDGIQVGGRNLAQQSSNQWVNWITLVDIVNFCPSKNDGLGKFILDGVSLGDYITISLEIEYQNLIKTATGSPQALFQGYFNKTQWNPSCPAINFLSQLDFTNGSGNLIISKSFLLTSKQLANDYGYYSFRFDYLTGKVRIRNFKVERGNKSTAWSDSPENVAQDATTKANTAESNAKSYANNTFTTKTEFSSQLTILNNSISSKVSQTDFNSLGSRVGNAETTISQHTNLIALKASQSDLTALGSRVTSAEAKITPDQINLTVQSQTQTIAQQAADNIQVGGRNLAQKSSNQWGNWLKLVDIFNFCPGGNDGLGKFILDGVSLGNYITISLEIEYQNLIKTATGSPQALFQGYFNKTQWNPDCPKIDFLSQLDFTNGGGNLIISKSFLLTSKQLANDYGYYTFRFDYLTGSVRVRNFKVERGNKPTAWSPAPENISQDATDKANTAESNAKSYANNTFTTKTEFSSQLTILNNSISSKVSQTDFNSLGSRVGNAETTISQHTNQIALKASQSDLTALGSRMTSAEAKITSDAINLTVKSQTQSLIDTNAERSVLQTLDLTGLDNNTYYPVTVYVDPYMTSVIQVKRGLYGMQNAGSYATHGKGFTLLARWSTNGSGWTAIEVRRTFYNAEVRFVNAWPIGNIGQNYMASYEHFYLRGGSTYDITLIGKGISNLWLHTSEYRWGDDTYNYTLPLLSSLSNTPEVTYKTVAEIQAGINIVAGGISVFGQELSFAGKVTFSSLASDAQNKITTAQSTADAANSTAGSALSSANAANADLSTLKGSLGSLAYANTVSLAKLDSTIIEGGYIKTSLINANAIITNDLLATKIAATDITTRRLTVGEGCMVGGFSIGSGRIGISASPENIGNAGMFLYADMIGFNSTNRQAIVGTYSVLGYPRLGQFIDTTSNYMPNVGLMFDINSTNNGGRNYAFTGRGHGVLNGFMCGYAFQELSFTKANQWQEISKLTSVVGIYGNYNNWAVVLPTFASVCNALNIGYNTPFVFQITVLCTSAVDSGKLYGRSNSGISGISGYGYPELHDWNNGIDNGGYVMGAGDSFQIVLWSSNSGTSSIPTDPGSYRAYIVNKLS